MSRGNAAHVAVFDTCRQVLNPPPPPPTPSVFAQLLYLPSLGACVLAGCLLRRRGTRHVVTPSCAPDSDQPSTANRENTTRVLMPNNKERGQEEKEEREEAAKAGDKGKDGSPVRLAGRGRDQQQQGPPLPLPLPLSGRPCPSPSGSSLAARAPACSSSRALLPAPKPSAEKAPHQSGSSLSGVSRYPPSTPP